MKEEKKKKEELKALAAEAAALTEGETAPVQEDETPMQEDEAPIPPEGEAQAPLAAEGDVMSRFFAALSPNDRGVLLALLGRLRAYEEEKAARTAEAETEACLLEMENEAPFSGILARKDALSALIARVGWLRELPLRDRLAAACYIDRGMQAHTPSEEEKLDMLLSDPALMRALYERQSALRKAQEESLPPAMPGRGRAPATLPKKPKNLGEAKRAAHRFFNL